MSRAEENSFSVIPLGKFIFQASCNFVYYPPPFVSYSAAVGVHVFIHKFFTFSKAEHNPKMAPTRVLILSHSFVDRSHTFLLAHYGRDFVNNFNLSDDLIFKWHGIGGRTIAKIRQYDLRVVESFAPDIVILELGMNDLMQLSALETGSAIEDLARLLYECYHVQKICVCQTLYREKAPLFIKQVNSLTKYL